MTKMMKLVALAVILVCFVAVLPAQAQGNSCMPIRLVVQGNLDVARPAPYAGWAGTVKGLLNDKIPLNGVFYSGPGEAGFNYTGSVSHETFRLVFDFGTAGKFVHPFDQDIAHYSPSVTPHTDPAPINLFGRTIATVKITPDSAVSSGWFVNATGNVSIIGVFVVNAPGPTDMGYWNAEVEGKICNVVLPAQ